MKNTALLIFVCSLFSISTIAQSNNETTQSTIYFLRSTGFNGSATAFKTFIDEKFVCRLNNNRYSIHTVPAGKHLFSVQFGGTTSKKKADKFEITTEPGKTYYVKVIVKNGAFINHVYCEEITENAAKKEIAKLTEDKACK